MYILKSENDTNPVVVDVEMEITDACWSTSGAFIAVAGIVEPGHCQLRFVSSSGKFIRTLNVAAQTISSISFNHKDTQMVLGIDHSICLAQIVPIIPWGYFKDTIVYAATEEEISSVVFYNSKTGERHIKKISYLVNIASGNDSVLLASSTPDSSETALLLCNNVGIPSL